MEKLIRLSLVESQMQRRLANSRLEDKLHQPHQRGAVDVDTCLVAAAAMQLAEEFPSAFRPRASQSILLTFDNIHHPTARQLHVALAGCNTTIHWLARQWSARTLIYEVPPISTVRLGLLRRNFNSLIIDLATNSALASSLSFKTSQVSEVLLGAWLKQPSSR